MWFQTSITQFASWRCKGWQVDGNAIYSNVILVKISHTGYCCTGFCDYRSLVTVRQTEFASVDLCFALIIWGKSHALDVYKCMQRVITSVRSLAFEDYCLMEFGYTHCITLFLKFRRFRCFHLQDWNLSCEGKRDCKYRNGDFDGDNCFLWFLYWDKDYYLAKASVTDIQSKNYFFYRETWSGKDTCISTI